VAESNISPVIDSVSATPAIIGDDQTSNLEVLASDADDGPLPLSYNWMVPAGSVSDPTSATPVGNPYMTSSAFPLAPGREVDMHQYLFK